LLLSFFWFATAEYEGCVVRIRDVEGVKVEEGVGPSRGLPVMTDGDDGGDEDRD
jgi:hypothetical protein